MENPIEYLEIENFKSIKNLRFDCKRINVFIGKPNVGKSNILEAISLLGFGFEKNYEKFLSSFIRYEELNNLFYDREVKEIIKIGSNYKISYIRYHLSNVDSYDIFLDDNADIWQKIANQKISINEIYKILESEKFKGLYFPIRKNGGIEQHKIKIDFDGIVKKYDFNKTYNYENQYPYFLFPPFGDNLFTILYQSKELAKEVSSFFKEYGLQLVLVQNENKLIIQKNLDGIVYQLPYSLIADTLQRIIFYLAVIHSNKNSVLVLEEPEVHAFPPYTKMLAYRISQDVDNQYFITTHSPYLLNNLIDEVSADNLAIYITYFEDYQTKVKLLTQEDISEIINDDIDIFFNLDRFLEDETID